VLAAADRAPAAVTVLDEGILNALQPDPLRREAILLLLQTGRQGEALDRIPAYLRDHPAEPDMLHNYAVLLSQTGRLPLALEVAGRLRDLVPADPRGYIDLGILLARSGDQAAAERVFSEGLRRFPDNTQLAHNLARLRSP
jgi:Flp pilus assembly protein TadD